MYSEYTLQELIEAIDGVKYQLKLFTTVGRKRHILEKDLKALTDELRRR